MKLTHHPFKLKALFLFCLTHSSLYASPQIIYKFPQSPHNITGGQAAASTKALENYIQTLADQHNDVHQIIVYHIKNHYLIYELSANDWQVKKSQIMIDEQGRIKHSQQNSDADETRISQNDSHEPQCPDERVEFVAISPFPALGSTQEAINMVAAIARKKYRTIVIVGDQANGQTYKNWMSCSHLKGFYSISHGQPNGLFVAKGDYIGDEFFARPKMRNIYRQTTVILNACQVFNYPFGPQIMFGNANTLSRFSKRPGPNAYHFMGGHTDLNGSSSELTSACYLSNAMLGAKMDYDLLQHCAEKYNFYYQNFALSRPGRLFGG